MKKTTLLLMMVCFIASPTLLTAQTPFSVSINGGTTYVSNPGSFAGYAWNGIGNHSFNNTNSSDINISITNYDETNPDVGNEIFINFSRVGFGNAPLAWGSDNSTTLATLKPSDFTDGSANITVSIPAGTLPVAETTDYVSGYNWILQVVGANASGQTYINYVTTIEEEITLSTKDFSKTKLAAFYNTKIDAIMIDKSISGNYSIYDITGRSITTGTITNTIDTSYLKGGMYILSTTSGVLKFVK
ncbi:hypothetical protein BN863_25380 [Formosa agariphila KMM 3901]|uniref:Secretion system C-terminal sorting domain-containing protein n=1 Tax=Formosa agariphila (strain DSM 15362 / KCTC 12365 / LMG 23005 / KMM 3901 / M-2Alg 35-1) TaxID=1347342 RepID=T2KNC6_FORAG|nr:hypothetical protein [Formosa agariphila]CDF80250.1 hypothetical protein BN863_25380 [Formosa agariphila KMM 3901]